MPLPYEGNSCWDFETAEDFAGRLSGVLSFNERETPPVAGSWALIGDVARQQSARNAEKAIDDYSDGNNQQLLNSSLRDNIALAGWRAQLDSGLDELFSQPSAKVQFDFTVFRGLHDLSGEPNWVDRRFASCSLNPYVARCFATKSYLNRGEAKLGLPE